MVKKRVVLTDSEWSELYSKVEKYLNQQAYKYQGIAREEFIARAIQSILEQIQKCSSKDRVKYAMNAIRYTHSEINRYLKPAKLIDSRLLKRESNAIDEVLENEKADQLLNHIKELISHYTLEEQTEYIEYLHTPSLKKSRLVKRINTYLKQHMTESI